MLFSNKDLRKLIIPLMFEQLLAVSVGMVDTLMVSQAGGTALSGGHNTHRQEKLPYQVLHLLIILTGL